MGRNGIIYPYWENAVRMTEDYAALLLVLFGLFAVLPAISVAVTIFRLIRTLWKTTIHAVKTKTADRIERHREETWLAANEKRE
jgi:Na+/H+-dicarboxylate symporter